MSKSEGSEQSLRDLDDLAGAVFGMLVAARDVLERAQRATLRLEQYRRSAGGAGLRAGGGKSAEREACVPRDPDRVVEAGALPF
jgi:hypothetical protein